MGKIFFFSWGGNCQMDFCAAEDILLRAKGVEEAVINEQEL